MITLQWDYKTGSNSNDGLTSPVKNLQCAFDKAARLSDDDPWMYKWNGRRLPNITIQMAPISQTDQECLTAPAFLSKAAGPVLLRGDPLHPEDYNIYGANELQGLAPAGGELVVDGFTLRGGKNCTLLNTVYGGRLVIESVTLGRGNDTVPPHAIGAAQGTQINVEGKIRLLGAGTPYTLCDFGTVFTVIQNSRVHFYPGNSIEFCQPMNFGWLFNGEGGGGFWVENHPTQSAQPVFMGAGLAGSLGSKYSLARNNHLNISAATIPGYEFFMGIWFSKNDGTCFVMP